MKKILLLFLLFLTSVTLFGCEKVINTPSLIGESDMTIEVGDPFIDPGTTFEDDDKIIIDGTVDSNTIGTYVIEYTIEYEENTQIVLTRTVHVVDTTLPIITLTGGDITINQGDPYIELGAHATDNYDGDLSLEVYCTEFTDTSIPGIYTIEYFVEDSSGNQAIVVTRTITVLGADSDNNLPVITLIGNSEITVYVGTTFTDPGVTAYDNEDGDLTEFISETSNVNTSIVGTYSIQYDVTDSNSSNAVTVTRIIHVVEISNMVYNNVYIEQYTDVNLNELEIDLGLDMGSLTIDTNTIGTTSETINDHQISFTIFDSTDELFIDINSIIIVSENRSLEQYQMYLSIPSLQEVDIYLKSNMESIFTLKKTDLELDILTLSLRNNSISRSAILDQGTYLLEFSSFAFNSGNYKIKLSTNPNWNSTNINIPQNDLLFSYIENNQQEYTFTITEEDNYEFALYSDCAFLVTITNQLNQTIIEKESYISHYHYQEFYISQTFTSGTYHVNVTFLDSPSTLKTFLTKGIEHNNLGYPVATNLSIDTTEDILVLPDRDWYQINVETDGFYTFDIKYSTGYLADFYIYDSDLKKLSYIDTIHYLETGKYYINFPYFTGEVIIEVNSLEPTVSFNDSVSTATNINELGEHTVFFDEYSTEKWFTFTLDDTTIIDIYSSFEFYYGTPKITLYDNDMNILEENSNPFARQLPAGTYYIKIIGLKLSITQFTIEEKSCSNLVSSDTVPYLLEYDNPVTSYIDYKEVDYYSLFVDDSNLTEFIYTGDVIMTMRLYKNNTLLETIDLYPNDKYISNLSSGTYVIELQSNVQSTIYDFKAKELDQSSSLWSSSKTMANEIDPEIRDLLYVYSEDISVYKEITITELTSFNSYLLNTKIIRVYNSSNEIIEEGNPYNIFPLALDVGTYVFELVSYGPGYIGFYDYQFNSINNFGGDFINATMLPDIHGIRGYNDNQETVDVMEFNVSVTSTYSISITTSNQEATYQILNSDEELLVSGSYNDIIYYSFEPGNYYIIVNDFSNYYELNMENLELKLVGTSFETATKIYPMVQYEKVQLSPFDETYFTFTIEEDGYFLLSYPTYQNYIELYDQSYNIYSSSYLIAGTYYLKLYQTEECNNTCSNQDIYLKVENITSKVFNNNITEAVDFTKDRYINGFTIEDSQVDWLTFTINENSIVEFYNYSNNYNTVFELYSLDGTTPEFITSIGYSTIYLEAGDYYIKTIGFPGEYTLNYGATSYTPVGNSISEAQPLDQDTLTINQIIKDDDDIDFYSFTIDEDATYQITTSSSASYNLYDSSGTYVNNDYNNGLYDLVAGEYYVEIYYYYGFTTYTLQVVNRDSYFAGDSYVNAKLIEPNGYYTGFATDGDVYYTFTITENSYLDISTYLEYHLLNSAMVELTNYSLTPGTYYLKLTPYYYNTIYNFVLTTIDSDDILANTSDTPVIIDDTFFSISSQLLSNQQEDWYQITIDSPQFYIIDTLGIFHNLTIYDSDLVSLLNLSYNYSGKIYLPEGTYKIRITDSIGKYHVTFNELNYTSFPDEKDNAYDLFLYEHINGYLFDTMDEAWFVFTIDNTKLLELYTPSYVGNYVITNAEDPNTPIYKNGGRYLLEAGTYYIQIINYNNVFINYDFVWHDYTYTLLDNSPTTSLQVPVYDDFYYIEGYYDGNNDAYISFTLSDNTEMVYKLSYGGVAYTILNSSLVPVNSNQLSAGTYYVRFNNAYLNAQTFEFALRNITQLDYPETPPTSVVINEYVNGYMSSNSEIDVFTITPIEDTTITIKLFSTDYQSFIIKTLDGTVLYDYSLNQYTSSSFELLLNSGTTYLIETTGIEGYYQFVVRSN